MYKCIDYFFITQNDVLAIAADKEDKPKKVPSHISYFSIGLTVRNEPFNPFFKDVETTEEAKESTVDVTMGTD